MDKSFSYGCGQCMPCRLNRRRIWTHRILLEALVHERSSFVTLTYSDDNLPEGGSLRPRDLQLFLKRLRKRGSVRFFGVGEYGDQSFRPHYHVALFGYPVCSRGRTMHLNQRCCDVCAVLKADWQLGGIDSGDLTLDSAQYIAGYVTKKMTSVDDVRLSGRYPEFARMSLRPGVGAVAIPDVAAALSGEIGQREIANSGDVPSVLSHGRRRLPLGRYMREVLRRSLNVEKSDGKAEAYRKSAEMLVLYKDYLLDKADGSTPFAVLRDRINKQKILQAEVRAKIWAGRKVL